MGIRLGPSAPTEATAATTASATRAAELPATVASSQVAPAATPPPAPPAPAEVLPSVVVGRGVVISCRTEDGDQLKGASACGSLGAFDSIARPKLAKLSSCPAARAANGKLSAVFSLDFKVNRVGVEVGKSSTVPGTDGFTSCLHSLFQGVSLGPVAHDQAKYAVVYSATFASSSAPASPSSAPAANPSPPPSVTPSSVPLPTQLPARTPPSAAASLAAASDDGAAQVVWEVALVRDSPRTGQVVARLQRGTKLRVGSGEDGWFKVQFGPSFGTEGYVYRGAIGK